MASKTQEASHPQVPHLVAPEVTTALRTTASLN